MSELLHSMMVKIQWGGQGETTWEEIKKVRTTTLDNIEIVEVQTVISFSSV